MLSTVFLHKSHIWKNFCPWVMGQNVLSQSDCRSFDQPYLQNKFFTCWCKLTQIKSLSKTFGVGVVRDECGQPGQRTLKLTVSQEWIDGLNGFFACWCEFRKAKSPISMNLSRCGQNWTWLFSSWEPKIC